MGDSSLGTGKGLPWGPTDQRGGTANLNPFKGSGSNDMGTGWDRDKTAAENTTDIQNTPEALEAQGIRRQTAASELSALQAKQQEASNLAQQTIAGQMAGRGTRQAGLDEENALINSRRRTGNQLYGRATGLGGY